jgi:hypothetical protein
VVYHKRYIGEINMAFHKRPAGPLTLAAIHIAAKNEPLQ